MIKGILAVGKIYGSELGFWGTISACKKQQWGYVWEGEGEGAWSCMKDKGRSYIEMGFISF